MTLFWSTGNRANLCTVTLLAWLSACDGTVAPAEEALLSRVLAAGGSAEDLDVILRVAKAGHVEDLELACRYVSTHFSRRQKRLLAQLAITLAVKDRNFTVGENYTLQFLADLLGIRPRAFAKLFQQITHRPFPEAGDPSSIDWWLLREAGVEAAPAQDLGPDVPEPDARTSARTSDSAPPSPELTDHAMTRSRALEMLGLLEGATQDTVRIAFRRLAKMRHPDRFAKLGPSAIAAASEAFQKLEEAYTLLKV